MGKSQRGEAEEEETTSSRPPLSKSSSADSAVEATEETLTGEEERTSCDKERLGEEERGRVALPEIPTH